MQCAKISLHMPDADSLAAARNAISAAYLADETHSVERLLARAGVSDEQRNRIQASAAALVTQVRAQQSRRVGVESFLRQFKLSTREGVLLMCVAEALLRIPDSATADRLIRDKFVQGDWEQHLGKSDSFWINASTWGLLLTGRIFAPAADDDLLTGLKRLAAKSGEPIVRAALAQAMRLMAEQFVMGRTIEEALARSAAGTPRSATGNFAHYRYSFDMLGEAALTRADARNYFEAYAHAIAAVGAARNANHDAFAAPSVSVKLSALHPRYEHSQRERVLGELGGTLLELTRHARDAGVALTIDAEESERLELSLDIFARALAERSLRDYPGLGLAVQAYQKRALAVIDWLAPLAREQRKCIPVRLVKGAYWDTEIKRAQVLGLTGYPVFTRKLATDVSYIACAQQLLAHAAAFYPQFATHNAHTAATILELAGASPQSQFEFQRLHGMGEALHDEIRRTHAVACRVYAPVGSHESLLPYLVRRLLENGANTSFVHSIADPGMPVEQLSADPALKLSALAQKPHPRIALPIELYQPERRNAAGISFADPTALAQLRETLRLELIELTELTESTELAREHRAARNTAGQRLREIRSPADRRQLVGTIEEADEQALQRALASATEAAPQWERTSVEERATLLERSADGIEAARARLLALLAREAGKTLPDALAEVREAADYCRYYAMLARRGFAQAQTLSGPTGELNQLQLRGRGVFAAISPWNFPLAIFLGQIAAALAAGNAVIAKPARQTPLIAAAAIGLLHAAGVPAEALHVLPGPGASLGGALAAHARISGIVFTGSTQTAQQINRTLAARSGPIVPFIAETGGQNAMIVDSSALPEQVVIDVVQSAFNSAGQRCSALRVLFLQEDIAERVLDLLRGAMQELIVGDPAELATDVGPVIDAAAQAELQQHIDKLQRIGSAVAEAPLGAATGHGSFIAPRAFEIPALSTLEREVFGPILHVIRYAGTHLDQVIDAINATGYGLTLGVHSRIDATARRVQERARAGNLYVNRNMIGAVVGVQPFGGEGLSGTGPKAGGPHYLLRFATERVLSVNTAASGGNAALLALGDA
jgi:RHH-type transcriptional regulator, proline utilization regulon repressor / proline dehydrogenase / delta 1-pyrroline-5-carboxylate dehydrogenase